MITKLDAHKMVVRHVGAVNSNAALRGLYDRIHARGTANIKEHGVSITPTTPRRIPILGVALLPSVNQDIPDSALDAMTAIEHRFSPDLGSFRWSTQYTLHHRIALLDSTTKKDFADLASSSHDRLVMQGEAHELCPSACGIEDEGALESAELRRFMAIAEEVAARFPPFVLKIQGAFATPQALCLQGFDNGNLNALRVELLKAYKKAGYYLPEGQANIIHISMLRFTEPLSDTEGFLRAAEALRDEHFGTFTLTSVSLAYQPVFFFEDYTVLKNLPFEG